MTNVPPEAGLDALRFAESRLGQASVARLRQPEARALLAFRLRQGAPLRDVVLGLAHEHGQTDPAVAAEFVGYFQPELDSLCRRALSPALRRQLTVDDLRQSVTRQLWPDLSRLEFRDEASFVGLLRRRVASRAAEAARRRDTAKRGAGWTHAGDPAAMELLAEGPGVVTRADLHACWEQVERILPSLETRDVRIIELLLEGAEAKDIANTLGLSSAAARMAARRSLQRLGDLLRSTDEGRGGR